MIILIFLMTVQIIIVGISSNTFSKINKNSNEAVNGNISLTSILNEASSDSLLMSIHLRNLIMYQDQESFNKYLETSTNYQSGVIENINRYAEALNSSSSATEEEFSKLNDMQNVLSQEYIPYTTEVIEAVKQKDYNKAQDVMINKASSPITTVRSSIQELTRLHMKGSEELINESERLSNIVSFSIVVLSSVTLLIGLVLSISVIKSITKPMKKLINATKEIANGNLNTNIRSDKKDEIGILSREFSKMVITLNDLIDNLTKMAVGQKQGKVDAFINEDELNGSFKKMAGLLNEMTQENLNQIEITTKTLNCINEIAKGDFNAHIETFSEDKKIFNDMVNNLRNQLKSVYYEIKIVVENMSEGNLNTLADESKYSGDWEKLIHQLNNLIKTINSPIIEVEETLTAMSKGNLDVKMNGEYKGDFEKMKTAANNMIKNISGYISEISYVLKNMAEQNLDINIKQKYVGKYTEIKDALELIIERFNYLIGEIHSSAGHVASGANQISDLSTSLAQGSTEQSSSIVELNSSIENIAFRAKENSDNSQEANHHVLDIKDKANITSDKMSGMLDAMNSIEESSNSISNIIKVIEDIAFQTNILALNAAVESARAGEHGKGFAVVAEEVRNLAGRSQKAAKETTLLIQGAINKIKEGSEIADNTATELKIMTEKVEEVSKLIEKCADASREQESAIKQIYEGINQISVVTQNNTATSEEAASASQVLSEQSDLFNNIVSQFKLKDYNTK